MAGAKVAKRVPRPVEGRGVGRPAGSASGPDRVRLAVTRALDLLDDDERPLHVLIAESLKADLPKTLTALRGFYPTEAHLKVESTAEAHLAALRSMMGQGLIEAQPMVDVTPSVVTEEATSDADNAGLEDAYAPV